MNYLACLKSSLNKGRFLFSCALNYVFMSSNQLQLMIISLIQKAVHFMDADRVAKITLIENEWH